MGDLTKLLLSGLSDALGMPITTLVPVVSRAPVSAEWEPVLLGSTREKGFTRWEYGAGEVNMRVICHLHTVDGPVIEYERKDIVKVG